MPPAPRSAKSNSDTLDPMRSVACVAGADYVPIGIDSMASDHFFGDRDAFTRGKSQSDTRLQLVTRCVTQSIFLPKTSET